MSKARLLCIDGAVNLKAQALDKSMFTGTQEKTGYYCDLDAQDKKMRKCFSEEGKETIALTNFVSVFDS